MSRDPHADGFLHDDSCRVCRIVTRGDQLAHVAREVLHDRYGPVMRFVRRAEARLAKAIERYENVDQQENP